MGANLITLGVVLAVLTFVVVPLVWKFIKGKFSASTQATGDKISAFIDEAAMLTALTPAWLLAKKRTDVKILELLAQVRVACAAWDDAAPEPAPAPNALETRLAALEAALRAKPVSATIEAK